MLSGTDVEKRENELKNNYPWLAVWLMKEESIVEGVSNPNLENPPLETL